MTDQTLSESLRLRPIRPRCHQQAYLQRERTHIRHNRHCGVLNTQLDLRHMPDAALSTISRTRNGAVEPVRHALSISCLNRLQDRLRCKLSRTDKRQRGYWKNFDPSGARVDMRHCRDITAQPARYVPVGGRNPSDGCSLWCLVQGAVSWHLNATLSLEGYERRGVWRPQRQ